MGTHTIATLKGPIFHVLAKPKTENLSQDSILKRNRLQETKTNHSSSNLKIIKKNSLEKKHTTVDKMMIHTQCQKSKTKLKALQEKLAKFKIKTQMASKIENKKNCHYLALGPYKNYPNLQREQQILEKLQGPSNINIRR